MALRMFATVGALLACGHQLVEAATCDAENGECHHGNTNSNSNNYSNNSRRNMSDRDDDDDDEDDETSATNHGGAQISPSRKRRSPTLPSSPSKKMQASSRFQGQSGRKMLEQLDLAVQWHAAVKGLKQPVSTPHFSPKRCHPAAMSALRSTSLASLTPKHQQSSTVAGFPDLLAEPGADISRTFSSELGDQLTLGEDSLENDWEHELPADDDPFGFFRAGRYTVG
mmetsp:Transcript_32564/g.69822  ORF Transcript_32564/g.69822 Transcript_32564/m.69822 type:complete len:226 (-) Transcript_32564:265-942(-)